MPEQHYLSVTQKARYTTLGELTKNTKQIWFVLHGYGQLSQYFIKKFSILQQIGHYVIAPEAIAKFYLHQHTGRVGATWMTKDDRLTAIENYTTYLNTLYDSLPYKNNIDINVIGFSQGAATASRWLTNGHVYAKKLLLWSGIFPPDLNIPNARKKLSATDIYNIYGTNDPYLTIDKIKERDLLIVQLKLQVHHIEFEGAHDIDQKTLRKLININSTDISLTQG